jgi:hypothetical protein
MYDPTYHYLIEQHLNYLDIPRLSELKIVENIDHPEAEVKEFLSLVNNGLDESDWKITCLRFALLRADSESN